MIESDGAQLLVLGDVSNHPVVSMQRPDWHVIFNGAEGWKEITGESGWEIVPAMRRARTRMRFIQTS